MYISLVKMFLLCGLIRLVIPLKKYLIYKLLIVLIVQLIPNIHYMFSVVIQTYRKLHIAVVNKDQATITRW
jgi:hypothetical protein